MSFTLDIKNIKEEIIYSKLININIISFYDIKKILVKEFDIPNINLITLIHNNSLISNKLKYPLIQYLNILKINDNQIIIYLVYSCDIYKLSIVMSNIFIYIFKHNNSLIDRFINKLEKIILYLKNDKQIFLDNYLINLVKKKYFTEFIKLIDLHKLNYNFKNNEIIKFFYEKENIPIIALCQPCDSIENKKNSNNFSMLKCCIHNELYLLDKFL